MKKTVAVVINQNQKEATLIILNKLMQMQGLMIQICLVDRGCVPGESLEAELKQFHQVVYYLNIDEMASMSETKNTVLKMVRQVKYDWLWWVLGKNGIWIKREVIEAVGQYDNRYFLGMDDYDWMFRAKQLGFKVQGKISERLDNRSKLQAYFWGRNPWLMIKLRLQGKWWKKGGGEIMGYWLGLLGQIIKTKKQRNWELFIKGSMDGWKLVV